MSIDKLLQIFVSNDKHLLWAKWLPKILSQLLCVLDFGEKLFLLPTLLHVIHPGTWESASTTHHDNRSSFVLIIKVKPSDPLTYRLPIFFNAPLVAVHHNIETVAHWPSSSADAAWQDESPIWFSSSSSVTSQNRATYTQHNVLKASQEYTTTTDTDWQAARPPLQPVRHR